jgi:hypothetical protein
MIHICLKYQYMVLLVSGDSAFYILVANWNYWIIFSTCFQRAKNMKTRLPGNFLLSPLISLLCTGCIGYSLDTPETVEVENPVPLSDQQFDADWGGPSRWACESQSASFSPLSRDYFRKICVVFKLLVTQWVSVDRYNF